MDPFLGQIQLFAFNYAPEGWMLCNGAMLNIQQYSALFALIGTTYGGDGSTTFALPNLMNATLPPNPGSGSFMCYYIAVQGIFPIRP